jgi:hypothetical protein
MTYFSIGMALHAEGSYENVLGLMTDGLAWTSGDEPIVQPSKSAIFQARSRLGSDPVQKLFPRVARLLDGAGDCGCLVGGTPAGRHRRHLSVPG